MTAVGDNAVDDVVEADGAHEGFIQALELLFQLFRMCCRYRQRRLCKVLLIWREMITVQTGGYRQDASEGSSKTHALKIGHVAYLSKT